MLHILLSCSETQRFLCELIAVGHKMLADVQKFSGVNEVCLEMEKNRKTEAFEKKLSDTGRQKLCENKNVCTFP